MAISKYQRFESVIINRQEIKNAEYNPRKISDINRKKLKENIKRIGYMGGIVVNKITMNLVSGHQRLAILDSLERKKDYDLTVSMVELTEKEEVEQNIFFNNQNAQGDFDESKLKEIFEGDFDINLGSTGFENSDLAVFEIDLKEFENQSKEIRKIQNVKEQLKKIRKETKEKRDKENDTNFFIALIFETAEEKTTFCKKYKLSLNEQYIKANSFIKLITK